MILITDITVQVLDNDFQCKIAHPLENIPLRSADPLANKVEFQFQEEIINGDRFVNARGEVVVLGMSDKARKTIGIYAQYINDLNWFNHVIDQERMELYRRIKDSSFLKRLKYLFTGKLQQDRRVK